MSANLVHETAVPGSLLAVTPTAGTDDGDRRISAAFPVVGQAFQAVLKSQTTGLWEEGRYTTVAANKFNRTEVINNSSGTTSRIDFGAETVDVWPTPVAGGMQQSSKVKSSLISTNSTFADNIFLHPGITAMGSMTANTGRYYFIPFHKWWAGDVAGFAINVVTAFGSSCFIGLFEYAPGGGIGALLCETTAFTPAATGWQIKTIAAAVDVPPGDYLLAICFNGSDALYGITGIDYMLPIMNNSTLSVKSLWDYVGGGQTSLPAAPTDLSPVGGSGNPLVGVVGA